MAILCLFAALRLTAGDVPADDVPAPPTIPEATAQDRADTRRPLPPTALDAPSVRRDFDLRGDARALFEQVARAFGLDCVFDGGYQAVGPFPFQLKDVDYRDALHGLEAATASFIVPLTPKLFLVVRDTPQKRTEVEPSVTVSVTVPDATNPQDFSALIVGVQQSMSIERVAWDTQNSTVILRGPISKVLPARTMLEQLLRGRGQLVVDVRLMEVSRNDMLTYGIDFPNVFSLTALTKWMNNAATLPTSASGVLTFGAGKTLMGLGIINASLVASMSQSSGSVLLDAQMRSIDGQPATFHVGDRYPIITGGYSGTIGASTSGNYIPPPAFTYEDLGLSLKVTPQVSGAGVTLDVDAQFKVLSGRQVNGIPVISSRAIKSRTRLEAGQWAAVGGLMNSSDARQLSGVPGLASIPYLGALTGTHERDRGTTQLLLLMRPRLETLPASESPIRAVRFGAEARPLTPI